MRLLRPLRSFVLALPVAAFLATPADADPRTVLSYELWKGGFHAVSFEAALERTRDAYSVDFAARTEGFIGWLYPYELETRSAGTLDGAGLEPRRFESLTRSRGKQRWRAVTFLEDGSPVTEPTPEPDERVPTTLARGALDPASAIFAVVEAVARADRCAGRYPVYDGRRRYDLALSAVGPEVLRSSRYGMYDGPTTRCRVTVHRLAGFRPGRERIPPVIDVWLAPVLDGRPAVPVRLEGTSDLGGLVIHLTQARLEPEPPEQAAR